MRHPAILAFLVVNSLLVVTCSDPEPLIEPEIPMTIGDLENVKITWINILGIDQPSAVVWQNRVDRACVDGVWNDEVLFGLSAEFFEADIEAGLSRAAGGSTPTATDAADALWLIAVQLCRDRFPDDSIELGPPSVRDG
ncbi:MAG: hypothetical protein HKN93_09165 [Acidimicrobiia bacterium]|nr:hypothetical protein [Acidimicrobiia bacterium]